MSLRLPLALSLLLLALPVSAQDAPSDSVAVAADSVEVETVIDANEARAQFNTGQGHLRDGAFETALAAFEEGIRLDVTNPKNYYGRGLALAQLERTEEAATAFAEAQERAEAASDGDIMTRAASQLLALALVESNALLRDTPVPPANAERVIALLVPAESAVTDETRVNYFYFLMRAYNATEDYAAAARYGQMAVEAIAGEEGDNSPIYYEYGFAEMNRGNADAARAAYNQALEGSYAGWAEYQLAQMEQEGAGGSQ